MTPEQQVITRMVKDLQANIAGWINERKAIQIKRDRHDAQVARFQRLGQLITEAQQELNALQARLGGS